MLRVKIKFKFKILNIFKFKFKVDRQQIIAVAKKYIYMSQLFSVGCLKCLQFHYNGFSSIKSYTN